MKVVYALVIGVFLLIGFIISQKAVYPPVAPPTDPPVVVSRCESENFTYIPPWEKNKKAREGDSAALDEDIDLPEVQAHQDGLVSSSQY